MKSDVFPSKNSLMDVHDKLLIPASHALFTVERAGLSVDKSKFKGMESGYISKMQELEDVIRSYPEVLRIEHRIKTKFNLNSYDQVRELLFQQLELPEDGINLTDGGKLSTGKETIATLKGAHKIVALINEHRKYATLFKMFVKPLDNHICPDGKVHCSYKIHGTVTGRLACEAPNLQQIPKNIDPDEVGFEFAKELNLKNLYVPSSKDHVLIQADYSQMELRVLAEYSQDPVMVKIFKDGKDIHIATGQAMADIAEPGVVVDKKNKWRKAAKAINFGIVYGKGDDSLALDLGVSVPKAQEFKISYFKSMPEVEKCINFIHKYVKQHHEVSTMFGNLRRLPTVIAVKAGPRNEALRQAVNMPIQGTASHYTLSSVINLVDLFKKFKLKSKLVATVHDSIIVDTHRSEVKAVVELMQSVMANPKNDLIYWETSVPFDVDVEIGDSWATLEPYQC